MKNLILYILLVFLVVANGFFLFNYMGSSNDGKARGPQNPGNFIIKELNFNELQLEQFREKNKEHHETMMRLSNNIKELKDALFNRLPDVSLNDEAIDSITSLIGLKEKEKEKETFYHFRSIQDICNGKQKEKFKNIIRDALLKGGEREQRPPNLRGAAGPRHPPQQGEGHRPPPKR